MSKQSSPQSAPLVFRRFERKSYSLFAAIGREVKVGVLTVATLSTAAPALAGGTTALMPQTEGKVTAAALTDDHELGESLVTASRAPLAAEVAARPVMTLGREQLAAAGVTSLNDVLKLSAVVDVRQRGGFGVQTDVAINGGTFDQITILVNGVSIVHPETGHLMADFPLNLTDIERIELLEGSASRLFGSQAFSGAINVVTRSGGSPFDFRTALGSNSTVQMEMRANLANFWRDRRFSSTLSAGFQKSDGMVRNSDFASAKAYWQGRFDNQALRLDAQAGLSTQEYGANTFYSAKYPDQWERTTRWLTSIKAETKTRIHIAPQFSWMRNYDNFKLERSTHFGENHHRVDVATGGVNFWTNWALGRTAIGAEVRREAAYSTNLGALLDNKADWVLIPGKTPVEVLDKTGKLVYQDVDGGNAYYQRHVARTNTSVFAEHNVLLRQWTLSVGVLAQRNTSLDAKLRFYPGVDLSYRPSSVVKLFASYNRALRLPTFVDLYYKSATHVGTANLKPEENSQFRVGAAIAPVAGWQLNLSAFHTHATNQVAWVKKADAAMTRSINMENKIYGLSASSLLSFEQLLGTAQPLRQLRLDYAYVTQDRQANVAVEQNAYVTEYLRHKFTATLTHRIVSDLSASWNFRLQERNGGYDLWENGVVLKDAAGNVLRRNYGTQAHLDLKLQWTQPKYELFCDLQNLTDNRAVDYANVPQAGFVVMAGLKFGL